jgi:hypothetical protein
VKDLVTQCYARELVPLTATPGRGQLWRAPMLYLVDKMQVLRIRSYDPAEEHRSVIHLRTDPGDLFNHLPSYTPRVEADEELLAVGAKRRMGVVASLPQPNWQEIARIPAMETYFLIPLYSFHEGHSEEFRLRVRAFEYPSLLYAPAEPSAGINSEGFLLLQRAQFVARSLMQPANIRLTDEAMGLVDAWLRYVLTSEIDPDLLELRRLLMQELLGGA